MAKRGGMTPAEYAERRGRERRFRELLEKRVETDKRLAAERERREREERTS